MYVVKLSTTTKKQLRKITEKFTVKEVETLAFAFEDGEHVATERVTFSVPEDYQLPDKPGYYMLAYPPQHSQYGGLEASRNPELLPQSDFKEPAALT